ncbi:DUF3427 domain-containing protein [Myroides profundi]|uniref:Helicase conserved C-terminal domain-containing protein n=1 Tax=Myroides profundi TaxID=480520 RepID=A0AAJ5BF04_MYRPR|nr:DEAD/DEAH box helicase [Myroides profundi]AJH16176.1 ATP-dependent helicase IRC3 [Myroides profundi]SER37418.1 Helicase conserved C-terminal domain-containing protein [Myroides profundi]
MQTGIYESLITESLKKRLSTLGPNYYVENKQLDIEEATFYLAQHFTSALSKAFDVIKGVKKEEHVSCQIEMVNKLITYLHQEIEAYDFTSDIINADGQILTGVIDRLECDYKDVSEYLKEVIPVSRLTQSELFTGGNLGLSLDSELKKEILSSDRVDLLVSFIKWKAIVLLRPALEAFTSKGGKLRVLTTTYMGATDAKAIEELSKLPNTEIKISYNIGNERLHAKAYMFYRNTGFHTAYIGSSNFSRSALTDGLEWNVKVTTKEIPQIINKFKKTFESYWNSEEFESYSSSIDYIKITEALKQSKIGKSDNTEVMTFFDLKPYYYQKEILEKLNVERSLHKSTKNLVVAATGTGKTMIAAFDFKAYLRSKPNAKMLFIAHRIDILKQARTKFRQVLRDNNFGELQGDGYEVGNKKHVFSTIQTLNNEIQKGEGVTLDYYDYIVFDEVHHVKASTYQKVLNYFKSNILLGLTATPERMDGGNIVEDFNNRIAAEIRLPDALNNKLLCPFQYFAISDSIDLTDVIWKQGKYDTNQLTKVYTTNDIRVGEIIYNIDKYTKGLGDITALGFCVSKEHAEFMNRRFQEKNLKSEVLTSDQSNKRDELIGKLKRREINYLFVVDIFNEGIDVPEIDTVLFLRPTESLTIFLQQLGRGLRLNEGKEVLTVLDFIGNSRSEYDFEQKFRALIGKTNTTVLNEIEQDFPHLPLGCSIVLEKQAKEYILNNIKQATNFNKGSLLKYLKRFGQDTTLPLTIQNFCTFYCIDLQHLYKNCLFSILKEDALGVDLRLNKELSKHYISMFTNKWAVTESYHYFQFVLQLIEQGFDLSKVKGNKKEIELMALMLHYDFWKKASTTMSIQESLYIIGSDKTMVGEMKEFLLYKIELLTFEEIKYDGLSYVLPLRIHSRYTREQILVAYQLSTLEKKSPNREGVAENPDLNTEVLFINLQKTEEDFSPTTMYDDYAINEVLFHWQSQSIIGENTSKGLSYINQKENDKKIALFVREGKYNEFKKTQGYVFLGYADFVKHEGSKPMSIVWQLEEPIPNYMWKETLKMRIG